MSRPFQMPSLRYLDVASHRVSKENGWLVINP